MIAPFPLYVDEISPDNIKATVSKSGSVLHNLRTMSMDLPVSRWGGFDAINGTFIFPVGKYICMVVKKYGRASMILLDLVGKEELAQRMAAQLDIAGLQEQFMEVYMELTAHPEKYGRFRWVQGEALTP